MVGTTMSTKYNGKAFDVVQVGERDYVKRVNAAAILLTDGNGRILLVEQDRGPFGLQLEIPAGKVEPNENPADTAVREAKEETGYDVDQMIYLLSYYPSVGYTTEEIHLFYGTVGKLGEQRLDDGEKVKTTWIDGKEIMKLINLGEIKDSKTLMALQRFLVMMYSGMI